MCEHIETIQYGLAQNGTILPLCKSNQMCLATKTIASTSMHLVAIVLLFNNLN